MTCSRCRTPFEDSLGKCPQCGAENRNVRGTYQTSTVLISGRGGERVFRSVEEVPAALRTKLLKSTNGANSATILIADRRGRREIAKAMRNMPGPVQKRWMQTLMATEAASTAMEWLTLARRRAILVAVVLLTVVVIALLFTKLG